MPVVICSYRCPCAANSEPRQGQRLCQRSCRSRATGATKGRERHSHCLHRWAIHWCSCARRPDLREDVRRSRRDCCYLEGGAPEVTSSRVLMCRVTTPMFATSNVRPMCSCMSSRTAASKKTRDACLPFAGIVTVAASWPVSGKLYKALQSHRATRPMKRRCTGSFQKSSVAATVPGCMVQHIPALSCIS